MEAPSPTHCRLQWQSEESSINSLACCLWAYVGSTGHGGFVPVVSRADSGAPCVCRRMGALLWIGREWRLCGRLFGEGEEEHSRVGRRMTVHVLKQWRSSYCPRKNKSAGSMLVGAGVMSNDTWSPEWR